MISASDFLHLHYTADLTEGGIVHALRSLPYSVSRARSGIYDHLRTQIAETAVEIALRRYLSEQAIPFEVKAAPPFSGHDNYDVILNGRRCEVKSFLIHQHRQVMEVQVHPEILLRMPALVASDQHAAEGYSPLDIYIFAFLLHRGMNSGGELQKRNATDQPHYFVHVMPDVWNRPATWNPLGKLALKSESEETQTIEIGGQDEGREMCSCTLELPSRTRLELPDEFFSLCYIHTESTSHARIGIHSPVRRETHIIGAADWGDLWIDGSDIIGAGYITREEFRRRASFVPAGSRLLPYNQTRVKNLAVAVSELRPLSELFERAKESAPVMTS